MFLEGFQLFYSGLQNSAKLWNMELDAVPSSWPFGQKGKDFVAGLHLVLILKHHGQHTAVYWNHPDFCRGVIHNCKELGMALVAPPGPAPSSSNMTFFKKNKKVQILFYTQRYVINSISNLIFFLA